MIEWVVLVLFLGVPDGSPDMYLFTDPSFTTIQECNQSMLEPESVEAYTKKIVMEFQEFKEIKSIQCVNKELILKAIDNIKLGNSI